MYTYNGKSLTEYEATQLQRYNERQIRRWKREYVAMEAAGLDTTESAAKVQQWQARQRDFLRQTGLKRQYARERISVQDNASTPAAVAGATVDVDGARLKTNAAGKAEFNLRAGDYTVKVSKTGYKPVTETVNVASAAVTETVTLIPNS